MELSSRDLEPSYLSLVQIGELSRRVEEAKKHWTECNICPHECGVNRQEKLGFCRATAKVVLASYGPHEGT